MKSVIVFVRQEVYSEDAECFLFENAFTESAQVGKNKKAHYKSPAEFVSDVQKMYTRHNNSQPKGTRFSITNVVIG